MTIPKAQGTGLLLVGHGTRDEAGLAEFAQTAQRVAALSPDFVVATAFLELAEPGIAEAIDRLAASGVEELVVAPLLLFAAGHAKRDIPAALQVAAAKYPHIEFAVTMPLACHPQLLELSAQRVNAVWPKQSFGAQDASLVVVGRGSLDAEATAEMHRYVETLSKHLDCAFYRVAFMAMAQPSLSSVLSDLIASNRRGPIVVLPHLLFQGDLLTQLQQLVQSFQSQHPGLEIRVAAHLGPAAFLAEALCDLVRRAVVVRPPQSLDKGGAFR
jgi:sirohydrochlorin cobaltochelatase